MIFSLTQRLKSIPFFAGFLTEAGLAQLKRYLVTGFSTAALEISLLWFFKSILRFDEIMANTFALTIVFWFNFLLNRLWSFQSKEKLSRQLMVYGPLFLFNLGASNLMMYYAVKVIGIHFLIAKVIAIGVIVTWNFIIYKKVIFK